MGLERQFRPIRTLSAYFSPLGGRVVVALRAYLDDSGDGDAPTEAYLTIAGFVAPLDQWALFEADWRRLLDEYGIPYLHMKEFGNPQSLIYRDIKADPARERQFIADVTQTIHRTVTGDIGCTVLLDDLRAFNAKHGLNLDPYALAIYVCLLKLRCYYQTQEIDIVADRFDRSMSRIETGLNYGRSDRSNPVLADLFTPLPLQNDQTWRDVLPLQAADFNAWEIRKYRRERAGFKPTDEVRNDRLAMFNAAQAWEEENKARDRRSFKALREHPIFRPLHVVLDGFNLQEALKNHPNGWGA